MADSSRIEDLRRRVQKDPASIAFAQLAEECRRAGDLEEAVSVCRAGLALHPTYLSARVTLGRALLELNQLSEAQTELQHVLRSAPENLAALRALAETLHRQGDLSNSLAQYRVALSLAKNDPDLQETVASLEHQLEAARVPEPAVTPETAAAPAEDIFAFLRSEAPAAVDAPPANFTAESEVLESLSAIEAPAIVESSALEAPATIESAAFETPVIEVPAIAGSSTFEMPAVEAPAVTESLAVTESPALEASTPVESASIEPFSWVEPPAIEALAVIEQPAVEALTVVAVPGVEALTVIEPPAIEALSIVQHDLEAAAAIEAPVLDPHVDLGAAATAPIIEPHILDTQIVDTQIADAPADSPIETLTPAMTSDFDRLWAEPVPSLSGPQFEVATAPEPQIEWPAPPEPEDQGKSLPDEWQLSTNDYFFAAPPVAPEPEPIVPVAFRLARERDARTVAVLEQWLQAVHVSRTQRRA